MSQVSLVSSHSSQQPLSMVETRCCVCAGNDSALVGRGYDYEYNTSFEEFEAHQCAECQTVYLNPRPDVSEFSRIYPPSYHSLSFTEENYSLVHRIRSRLEARRLLDYCRGAPTDARILDVGCGDGFHLGLLRKFGHSGWTVEGLDIDSRAAEIARRLGVTVHTGTIEDVVLPDDHYDVIYTIQTLEHVADPYQMLRSIHRILKPGGRLVVVTDNTESVDFTLFKTGYWGGYHFPRHWNLFNRTSLDRLARRAGYETESINTIVSPVNWVYSIHNWLTANRAPFWMVNRFTLRSPISLGLFTLVDTILSAFGRGALLNGYFKKPDR